MAKITLDLDIKDCQALASALLSYSCQVETIVTTTHIKGIAEDRKESTEQSIAYLNEHNLKARSIHKQLLDKIKEVKEW